MWFQVIIIKKVHANKWLKHFVDAAKSMLHIQMYALESSQPTHPNNKQIKVTDHHECLSYSATLTAIHPYPD